MSVSIMLIRNKGNEHRGNEKSYYYSNQLKKTKTNVFHGLLQLKPPNAEACQCLITLSLDDSVSRHCVVCGFVNSSLP